MPEPGDLVVKDPNSTEPFSMDWTAYLADLGEDVTIFAHEWEILVSSESPPSLTLDDESMSSDDRVATAYFSGGTRGKTYTVRSRITTNSVPAVIDDRSFKVRIAQK